MTRLYRSTRDKKITGLCGGIAEILNVDSTLLRLVVVLAAIFSSGAVFVIYVVASIIIPKESNFAYSNGPNHRSGHTGGYAGGHASGYNGGHSGYTGGNYHTGGFTNPGGYNAGPQKQTFTSSPPNMSANPQPSSEIDEMMRDIEKKAMQKELDQLRAKLAEFEKGEK